MLGIFVTVLLLTTGRCADPGYYVRLLDLPAICPYLSFVTPWSPNLRTLSVVRVGNISISVSGFFHEHSERSRPSSTSSSEAPSTTITSSESREELSTSTRQSQPTTTNAPQRHVHAETRLGIESKIGPVKNFDRNAPQKEKPPSTQNETSDNNCIPYEWERKKRNKLGQRMHIGPVSVRYRQINIEWHDLKIQITGDSFRITDNNMTSTGNFSSSFYRLTPTEDGDCIVEEFPQDGEEEAEFPVPRDDEVEDRTGRIALEVNVPSADINFYVSLSSESFHIRKHSHDEPTEVTPWIILRSIPFVEDDSVSGLVHSSGLLPGLTQLIPNCNNLSCLQKYCYPFTSCCSAMLGHTALLRPQYGPEYTSNFITFTRQELCSEEVPFSSGCSEGWSRFRYICYKSVPLMYTWRSANSFCKSYGAKLALISDEEEVDFIASISKLPVWVGGNASTAHCQYPKKCWILDKGGIMKRSKCNRHLQYVCKKVGCKRGQVPCCKLTYYENLKWKRHVVGMAIILRPGREATQDLLTEEENIGLTIAYSVIGATIAFVVIYRMVTKRLEQRRYTMQNLTRM